MDQIGALVGPLTVAGVLALTDDDYAPALGVLAIPGVAAIVLLFWLRAKVPNPVQYEPEAVVEESRDEQPRNTHAPLPRAFWSYAAFTATTMIGFATFGVLSFHLVQRDLVPTAAVPLLYAAAMGADAVAALATGWLYDRVGPKVLSVLPVLSAAVVLLAFSATVWVAVLGALLWGAAVGVQESTLRATVADLVPAGRRATAYGVYAGVLGAAALVGGALTGALYDWSVPALVVTVLVVQAGALVILGTAQPVPRAAHEQAHG
jgi:MFS family permease